MVSNLLISRKKMEKSYLGDRTKEKSRELLRYFIRGNLILSTEKPENHSVLHLPGPESREVIEVYDKLGIPRSNVTGIEKIPDFAAQALSATPGMKVECALLEEYVGRQKKIAQSIISLDFDKEFSQQMSRLVNEICSKETAGSFVLHLAVTRQREKAKRQMFFLEPVAAAMGKLRKHEDILRLRGLWGQFQKLVWKYDNGHMKAAMSMGFTMNLLNSIKEGRGEAPADGISLMESSLSKKLPGISGAAIARYAKILAAAVSASKTGTAKEIRAFAGYQYVSATATGMIGGIALVENRGRMKHSYDVLLGTVELGENGQVLRIADAARFLKLADEISSATASEQMRMFEWALEPREKLGSSGKGALKPARDMTAIGRKFKLGTGAKEALKVACLQNPDALPLDEALEFLKQGETIGAIMEVFPATNEKALRKLWNEHLRGERKKNGDEGNGFTALDAPASEEDVDSLKRHFENR